ncbi:MAG: DUF1592 domain-containing protein [Planctomycetaceae bacterium]
MTFRTILLLCLSLCVSAELCDAQETAENNLPISSSLEQIKIEAAKRSKYTHRLRTVENVSGKTPTANLDVFRESIEPILKQNCVPCHGPESVEGNIRIDTMDPDLLTGQDVNWWLEIQAVLSNGEMPPPDADELPDEDRSKVVEWLSSEIQTASIVRRTAGGHSSFRRMTRYEYNYALQDLLGVPWNFAKDLPPEAHSEDGFQNSSEMLHMSVTQLETYRQLALNALQRATVRGERPPVIHWGITMEQAADREWPQRTKQLENLKEKFKDDPEKQKQEIDQLLASFKQPHSRPYYRQLSSGDTVPAVWQYNGAKYAFAPTETEPHFPETFDHVAVIPSGRNQQLTVELGDRIPDEGLMRVRIRASRSTTEDEQIPSLQLEFGFQASNEGRAEVRVSGRDTPILATADAPKIYQWDVPLGEIYPRNSFRHIAPMGGLPSPSEYLRFVNSSVPQGRHGDIQIDYVEVTAPVYDEWPPQSHRRIFFDSENRADEARYARDVLTRFMSLAWRRTLHEEEVDRKLDLFQSMRQECDTFEEAMVEVLATVLSSPQFLYVIHEETAPDTALNPYELATRLSMFLWCSVPDEELLTLARNGQLSNADILTGQVDRMLNDPRSNRFAQHFVHQWLDMQLLDFLAVEKRSDPELKEAMQQEPMAFFQEMLQNNQSVLDFIHADYAMVNERLAVHYGITDVRGNEFRRIPLQTDQHRGGLLTQAGLLAMNSNGVDSHPLKRGVWLLECLLNDPPPPPPPAVPAIDLADPEIAKLTLKERIENHRNHPACMSCHAKIDPWGIAFENYDALGRWRNQIDGKPVDASSLLFNQQELDGMNGLKRFLLEHRQDQFVRSMVYKLSTFALGRPLTFSDYAAIDTITADTRQNGDGLADMIQKIVASELFRSR